MDAASKIGGGDAPRLQAEAASALRTAEEDLASGHKERAIADAIDRDIVATVIERYRSAALPDS